MCIQMKRTIAIISLILFVSCTSQEQDHKGSNMFFFKKKDPIVNFWNWFTKNSDQLHKINDKNSDDIINRILSKIAKVQPELSIEISKEVDGIREMTISPEGDIEKFDIVKTIVEKAPSISGWEIIAFRQPAGFDFTLTYQNIKLSPSELYFYPTIDKEKIDVIIYGKGFNEYDFNTLAHYGLIMMDNVLGEYDCVTKIRFFDFKDISEVEDMSELMPLTDIRTYINQNTQQLH